MRTVDFRFPRHAIVLCIATLTLAGCQLGPKGIAPDMPLPDQYGVTATPAAELGPAGATQKFALDERPVPKWWEAYRSLELSAWVEEALGNNYSLSQTEHSLAGAREQLRVQIGESMFPTVDAVMQSSRRRALGLPTAGPQTNTYNVFAGELNASYTFDLFGAVRYANSALVAQVDEQSYKFDAARRTLAANVVITAINSAALRSEVDTTEQLIALADADTADVQYRFELGSASRGDLLNAQANADSLRASLPGLRAQWQATRHALAVLMGRTPDAAPTDLSFEDLVLPERIPLAVPSVLLQQRPDILAADAALKAAAAQEALATAEMFPSLSITASFGQSGYSWSKATSAAGAVWGIGTSLTQPIFHGGALRAKRRAAQDAYEASQDNYRQTVLSAFQNVADSLSALTHDADAVTSATSARQSSEQYWQDAKLRATFGAIAPNTVRAGEKQFQNARLTEIHAVALRLTDTAVLFQAMGAPLDEDNAKQMTVTQK
jgi:NodT family efflux transporter outer membrane factor (OMF) lipoprotein